MLGSDVSEWALARIDISISINAHSAALQDGRFLAQFYTCHPADKRYNAVNQRYLLEYHPNYEVANPYRNKHTRMICPTSQSKSYAKPEGLKRFTQWVRLTNSDTYITGPFDFAEINGTKIRVRVPQDQWRILTKFDYMFSNEVPSLSLPEYAVHFGQFHTVYSVSEDNVHVEAYFAHPLRPSTV